MRWTRSRVVRTGILGLGLVMTLGAAPPTPTNRPVPQRIDPARGGPADEGPPSERASDWIGFFDALAEDLGLGSRDETPADRPVSPRDAMAGTRPGPSGRVHQTLLAWLTPRLDEVRGFRDLGLALAQIPGDLATGPEGTDRPSDGRSPETQTWLASIARLSEAIHTAQQEVRQNATIRRHLSGIRPPSLQDFGLEELGLSSSPWMAYASDVMRWATGTGPQLGPEFPRPPGLALPDGGLGLDAALTNLVAGFDRTGPASQVENLLITIVPSRGDVAPGDELTITPNASYEDLLEAIDDVQARSDDPNAVILRVFRPADPPELAFDSGRNLVALLRDVTIEVPAPESTGGLPGFGSRPRVLRYLIGELSLTISAAITPDLGDRTVGIRVRIESVAFGVAGTTVSALGDQEDQATTLNLLNRSGALAVLTRRMQGRELKTSASVTMLPDLLVTSISELTQSIRARSTAWPEVSISRSAIGRLFR